MAKYINREELVAWLKRIPLKDLSDGLGLCRVIMEEDFKRAIRAIPEGAIVDLEPVKRGRWVSQPFGVTSISRCSKCETIGSPQWNYCPSCGADMRGINDE